MARTDGLTGASGLLGLTVLVEVGEEEATGVVSATDGATIAVTLDEQTGALPESAVAQLSIFAPDALYRLTGRVSIAGRELRSAGDAPIERIQRRRWPRRRLDLPVILCPVAGGVRLEGIPGRTVDLSIGGCCVETLRPVEGEGDPMVILSLPDGTTIVSGASSIASEDLGDGWRYRLAFRDLEAHDAGRLSELTV